MAAKSPTIQSEGESAQRRPVAVAVRMRRAADDVLAVVVRMCKAAYRAGG